MSSGSNDKSLNDCGCCETDSLAYPEHYNRPGQPAIKYRLDTHGGFVQRMLARLSRDQLPAAEQGERRPLAKLTTRNEDDPAIAILDAWGMVADVLTFYQERIANEGFIRTAGERRSVLEMARAIGYELNPGVAASTYLAFTADNSPGSPPSARVPKGTQVLSIPGKDEVPQTFETTAEIIARAEWNALQPYTVIESGTDPINDGVTQFRLTGTATGLNPGDGILIVGKERIQTPGSERWDFRILTSVTPAQDGTYTLVTWERGLGHLTPTVHPAATDVQVFAFAIRTAIFGKNAAVWSTLASNTKTDYLTQLLGATSNISVSKNGKRMVFAGSNNSLRVWTYLYYQKTWVKEAVDITTTGGISSVVVSPSGNTIVLGHKDGALSKLRKSDGVWQRQPIPDAGVAHAYEVEQVAFSSDNILIVSLDVTKIAKIWTAASRTLRHTYTPGLTATGGNITYRVGSDDRDLTLWQVNSSSSPTVIVHQAHADTISSMAISPTPDGNDVQIISAAADGTMKLWTRSAASGVWTGQEFLDPDGEAAHAAPIIRLAFSDNKLEIISTALDGVSRLWNVSSRTLVRTFYNDTLDYLTEWPDYNLIADPANPQLTLDENYPTILAGSWMVLQKPTYVEAYNVTQASTAWHTEFNISAEVSQLELDISEHLNWFGRRDTTVYAGSRALELYVDHVPQKLPIEGKEIELDRLTPELEIDRMVVVSGQRMRARIIAPAALSSIVLSAQEQIVLPASRAYITRSSGTAVIRQSQASADDCPGATDLLLTSADEFSTRCLYPNDSLIVTAQPKPVKEGYAIKWNSSGEGFLPQIIDLDTGEVSDEVYEIKWQLQDRNGFDGTVTAAIDEIMLIPPLEEDAASSEVVLIDDVLEKDHDNRLVINSLILFDTALVNIYDHDSVSINANVAPATHGETVAMEVMGSGDGTKINQRFVLNKKPLTYISAPTASGGESTLEVRVNGVLWKQVSSLYQQGTRSQSYVLRHDNDSNSIITFGDGKQGARLPTGQENIIASYRSGIGPDGEVGAETLRLLKSKPLGIREVNNPLAATGAAAPEVLDDARSHAPLTVLTLERIVSVNDFEDFAAAFAGIGKAQATVLWNGETNIIHITIATASGETVQANSLLYSNLLLALDQVRDTTVQVLVAGYTEIRFKVEAQLVIDSRYLWTKVEANVKAALQAAFTFDKRAFGQGVTEAEVLSIILGVEGVIAAELTGDKLMITKGPVNPPYPGLEMLHLRAAKAAWDATSAAASPAQLLMINPAADGVVLKEMTA